MSLTGKAIEFANRSKNQKDIWEVLEEEYAPTEEDDRYELEVESKGCMMENTNGNSTDWFNRLDEIHTKLSNIE